MEFFSEKDKPLGEDGLPDQVKSVAGELRDKGYELEPLESVAGVLLEGPILRVKVVPRLPSRGPVADIRSEEYLLLGDLHGLPAAPPGVRFDRVDFPRNLPHINQTRKTSPVWPCLIAGSLAQWFQDRTVVDLVRQTEQWLADAAAGLLMAGDEHTFEPIFVAQEREYEDDGHWWVGPTGWATMPVGEVIAQAETILGTSPPAGIARARFIPLDSPIRVQPPVVAFDRLLAEDQGYGEGTDRFDFFGELRTGVLRTHALPGLVVFLGETEVHEGPPPDEVSDFAEWCQRLGASADDLLDAIKAAFTAWDGVDRIVVSLLILRPRPVSHAPAGHPYRDIVTVQVERGGRVASLMTTSPLDRESLRRFNGVLAELPRSLLVGAGALGSKLGTHLVRTTGVDLDIVDHDVFVDHNLARHDLRRIHVGLNKAEGLSDELTRLLPSFMGRGHAMTLQQAIWQHRIDPGDYGLTIDMSALPRMPDVLAHFEDLPRVFSGFSIMGGRCAVATLEGPERNPRSDDLNAAVLAMAASNPIIDEWIRFDEATERIGYGGCAQASTVVADDDISLHAARLAKILRESIHEEESGLIWILDGEGQANRFELGETEVHEEQGWSIRVTSTVRETVLQALEVNRPNEVAGYLHGLRDVVRKHLIVSHASVEPLIVQSSVGVEIDTSKYEDRFGGALEYLGSWHTHPQGGHQPSETDEGTAARMAGLRELSRPLVFVIAEPKALTAHVRG